MKVLVNVEEEEAHRAQASVLILLCCLTHVGMSAGCETASSEHETHEESLPACSLLFTALTSSEASAQERFLPSPCTGLLVVPLQWLAHCQLTQLLSGAVWLSQAVPQPSCGTLAAAGASPWVVQARWEQGQGRELLAQGGI